MLRGGKSYVSARPAFSPTPSASLSAQAPPSASLAPPLVCGFSNYIVLGGSQCVGHLRHWDFAVPELMKTIDIKMPIFSVVVPSTMGQPGKGTQENDSNAAHVFAYLSVENTPKPLHGQIRKCNLTESRLAGGALSETRKPEAITISPSGKFFGIRNKRKLHIWRVPAKDSKLMIAKNFTLHHTRNFTVLAFHPTQTIVAAGDTSGRILIWTGFGKGKFSDGDKRMNERSMNNEDERDGVRGDDDADASSTWHWHGTGISVLSFSSDGAYLYSGGMEGVFVVWQLDTGKKKFLRRIGSPLLYLTDSPDPSLSSISCADNQIHMLKMPYMEILEVYFRDQGYMLSLIDSFRFLHLCVLYVFVVTVIVTLVSLSGDGSMMSTVEVKLPEEGLGGLVCLKFWASGSQNKSFSLSTVVYEPHRDARISSLACHPTCRMVASSS